MAYLYDFLFVMAFVVGMVGFISVADYIISFFIRIKE